MVCAGDGKGPRAGLRALVPPCGRSRRQVCSRRAVRALLAALPPAHARLVPRSGGTGCARGEGSASLTGRKHGGVQRLSVRRLVPSFPRATAPLPGAWAPPTRSVVGTEMRRFVLLALLDDLLRLLHVTGQLAQVHVVITRDGVPALTAPKLGDDVVEGQPLRPGETV